MIFTKTECKLLEKMENIDIIDCHEHLPPEAGRLTRKQDVFTLFSFYTKFPLFASGLSPKDYALLYDWHIPLEKRWQIFRPHLQDIRFTSYARSAFITAKEFYGFDDINDHTYKDISAKIVEMNRPGIYDRIFEHCRIRAVLTQCGRTDVEKPLCPLMPGRSLSQIRTKAQLEEIEKESDVSCRTLEDYLELCQRVLKKWEKDNAVGIKFVSQTNTPPDLSLAKKSFARLIAGKELLPDSCAYEPLENFLMHKIIDYATELNLVIAMHSGVWGDFRNMDPRHMTTIAPLHPNARFDLYHLGVPDIRAAIMVGAMQPNVWTNLCWVHIVSQEMACAGINELLDMIPVNKVLAFGGDYGFSLEKIVGHLRIAKENLARVLGARIDKGKMNLDDAEEILNKWFWENPLKLYNKIDLPR